MAMERVVNELKEQNAALTRKLEAAEAAARATAATNDARMSALREEIDDYENAEVELAAFVDELKAEIENLKEENAELTRANAALTKKASSGDSSKQALIDDLESQLAAAQGTIAALEEAGGGGGGDSEALASEVSALKSTLESKQLEWEASTRAKVEALVELRSLVESLAVAGPSAAGALGGDNGDSSSSKASVKALKKELAAALVEQEALQESKNRLETTISEVEGKLIAARMQLGELKFQKEQGEINANSTIKKLEKKLAKLQHDGE